MVHQSKTPEPRSAQTAQLLPRKLNWPPDRDFRILSIDGGGIRGILPAALLARLESHIPAGQTLAHYFDLVCGTSTGGLLALGIAAGFPCNKILDLYMQHGGKIFPDQRPFERILREAKGGIGIRYDGKVYARIVEETFESKRLGEARCRLCVPAFEARHGEPWIYKTPHHPRFVLDRQVFMAVVARATSAAPTFFAPVESDGYCLVDGGIWANDPIMVGVVDALSNFEISPRQIRVLTLGCGSGSHRAAWWKKQRYAIAGPRLVHVIDAAMRCASHNARGQAGLLVGRDRIVRLDAPPDTPSIKLDDYKVASVRLPSVAAEIIDAFGDEVIKTFLNEPVIPFEPIL